MGLKVLNNLYSYASSNKFSQYLINTSKVRTTSIFL